MRICSFSLFTQVPPVDLILDILFFHYYQQLLQSAPKKRGAGCNTPPLGLLGWKSGWLLGGGISSFLFLVFYSVAGCGLKGAYFFCVPCVFCAQCAVRSAPFVCVCLCVVSCFFSYSSPVISLWLGKNASYLFFFFFFLLGFLVE